MSPGGTGDDDPAADPDRATVFDPVGDALGDRQQVDLAPSDDQGQVRGLTDGRGGIENLPLTPYTDRIRQYRDTALESLDGLTVPPSVRDVVRDYFTQLAP